MKDIYTQVSLHQRELGKRVRQQRKRSGLTQQGLAERISINRLAVWSMEAGKRKISTVEILRLAKVLNCPVETLLFGEEGSGKNRDKNIP